MLISLFGTGLAVMILLSILVVEGYDDPRVRGVLECLFTGVPRRYLVTARRYIKQLLAIALEQSRNIVEQLPCGDE